MTPLVAQHCLDAPLCFHQGRWVCVGEFVGTAQALAASLPQAPWAINGCEDRYAFMVVFAALLLRGQASLMPSTRAPSALQQIVDGHPGAYYIGDSGNEGVPAGVQCVALQLPRVAAATCIPAIAPDQLAAVAFTSGSTGAPKPNRKPWGMLVEGTRLASARFLAEFAGAAQILATVPPQHMYGLETSVLLPLLGGAAVHSARPLFPADLAAALAQLQAPRVLVTTPFHLRACIKSGLSFPPVQKIISATAPLSASLAQSAETLFGAQVHEIYGCTEAGSLASRRTVAGPLWQMYPQMRIENLHPVPVMHGPQLAVPVPFQDLIDIQDNTQFALQGRSDDLINIAGKRGSLLDLTHQLLTLDGVEDAVVVVPQAAGRDDGRITRLAALVVAPTLTEAEVTRRLRERVDSAFLPRPLYRVDQLPRSASSKLPKAAVLQLLQAVEAERA